MKSAALAEQVQLVTAKMMVTGWIQLEMVANGIPPITAFGQETVLRMTEKRPMTFAALAREPLLLPSKLWTKIALERARLSLRLLRLLRPCLLSPLARWPWQPNSSLSFGWLLWHSWHERPES